MLGRDTPCCFVIYTDKVSGYTWEITIDKHKGLFLTVHEFELLNHRVRGSDHKRVQPAGKQLPDLAALQFWILLGRGDDQ
jgi:hypothetical protein